MPPAHRTVTDAIDALLGTAPLVTRWIERLLAGHDPPLTTAQYLVLRAIAFEELTGGELARRTGVSGPAVSQLLAGLAGLGLIERASGAGDRRRVLLSASETGLGVLQSAQAALREGLSVLLADLPRPELDALGHALPHVEAALAGTPPPRRPRRPFGPPGPHQAPPPPGPRPRHAA
jgi:DNA-binding MarR family transcriptional regulator